MFNQGDIIVAKSGYNCVLVDFYQVIKATEKSVVLQEINEKVVKTDNWGQSGYVQPDINNFKNSKPIRRVAKNYCGDDYVKISTYTSGRKWDGKDVWFDTYD